MEGLAAYDTGGRQLREGSAVYDNRGKGGTVNR